MNDFFVNEFSAVDYTVLILLLGISCFIGLYFGCFSKNEQTTEEYLLGGKRMKTIPIAISLIASQLSALSIMVLPAEMYAYGPHLFLMVPAMIFVNLLTNIAFLPVFYENNLDNCYNYLELRFSKYVKNLVTACFIISTILLLPVFLFIPALAFSQVTGGNVHLINAIVCTICVFYTMLGGIKAVVWTDVVQAAIMIASILMVVVIGVTRVGGITEVWDRGVAGNRIRFFDTTLDLTTRHTLWNVLISFTFGWLSYLSFNQSCVQRLVSVPSLTHAKRVIHIFTIGFIVIMSMNCFTGLIMYAYFYDCDPVQLNIVEKPDSMIPYFVQHVVGHIKGMSGVFISCVFSASLSTISANFNALAGIIYSDCIKPLNIIKHTEKKANLIMKLTIILLGIYGVITGVIVEQFASIFQMVSTLIGLAHGVTFGVFSLGMFYPWACKKAVLWATLISTISVSWIICGAQVLIARGELYYNTLPTSIEGCAEFNLTNGMQLEHFSLNNITTNESFSAIATDTEESFSIYKISFQWYPVLGALLIWLFGVPLSHIIGVEDITKLNPNLISPIAKFLLPKSSLHHIQLNTQISDDTKDCKDNNNNNNNSSKEINNDKNKAFINNDNNIEFVNNVNDEEHTFLNDNKYMHN